MTASRDAPRSPLPVRRIVRCLPRRSQPTRARSKWRRARAGLVFGCCLPVVEDSLKMVTLKVPRCHGRLPRSLVQRFLAIHMCAGEVSHHRQSQPISRISLAIGLVLGDYSASSPTRSKKVICRPSRVGHSSRDTIRHVRLKRSVAPGRRTVLLWSIV